MHTLVACHHTLVSNAKHANEQKTPFTKIVYTSIGNNSLKVDKIATPSKYIHDSFF